ncbi:hypothetical protein NAT47_08370 [Flavobacterium sp. HXWNR69]|uniref:DUF4402 domain-containing protein n=1 Tax=Flavobacterium fragile TaxID=2949085 RepID=A0ABT0TJ41_9FLAO|nr:hypothetical protein [Flavobacterium sp. HXWNR69]MCL9770430.1 hypothetical protein [Flavobacterium sp. HXWNR69]
MKKLFLLLVLFLLIHTSYAQVGIGTTTPRGALDVNSSSTGFLPPQVALTSTTDITTVTNPQGGSLAEGTIVYNTTTVSDVIPGYYNWNGTKWVKLAIAENTVKSFNSSGAITNQIKKWYGTVTGSTADGQSINISSAGFTTILSVHISPVNNVNNEKGAIAQVKSVSTTAIVVNMLQSKTTAVLLGGSIDGLQFHSSPSSVTYYVEVTGY